MNIKRVREKKRISQRELARMAGVSLPTINAVETGKVTNAHASTRRKIENALGALKTHPVGNKVPDSLLERMDRVRGKLDSMDTANEVHLLEEMTESVIVYSVAGQGGKQYYRVEYSINDDGTVEFKEDTKTQVQVTWTPVEGPQNQSKNKGSTMNNKGSTMNNKQLIQQEEPEEGIQDALAFGKTDEQVKDIREAQKQDALWRQRQKQNQHQQSGCDGEEGIMNPMRGDNK